VVGSPEGRWGERTKEDYRWRLEHHILPAFGAMALDRITLDDVESYIAGKIREGLAPRSINMTLTLLAAILDAALDRDLIRRNPAKGRERRVRERRPQRSYLDSAEQIRALLDAGGELDTDRVHRKAMITLLLFTGLRIGELTALRWSSVDLAGGWLSVEGSKTDAGVRRIKIRGIVRDVLLESKPTDSDPNAYVFATASGGRQNPSNIRNRVIAPAEARASQTLSARGYAALPHLTPHSCRRTFASILYALGEQPPVVMAEMGHTSPSLALAVYAQAMRREPQEVKRLQALVDGGQMADSGRQASTGSLDALAATPSTELESTD
jgi:integrase